MRRPETAQRVAIVLHGFSAGGIERSMLRLGDAFRTRSLEVDFVVGQAKGELLGDVPPDARIVDLAKAPVSRAFYYGLAADPSAWKLLLPGSRMGMLKRLVRRLPSLVDYLRKTRPDAILAAEPGYNAIAVWGRRLSGLNSRVVISERVSHQATSRGPWHDPRLRSALRRAYLSADAIVAISDGLADDLATHAEIPRKRITTVYNPVVGPDLLAQAHQPSDHPWFAPHEPPVVLGVGRLHPQKDFSTLIRAFARLRAERRARLVILGAASRQSPDELAKLKALAAWHGIADDVDMPGFHHNPFACMRRASVFVLSSAYEGLGNVLIEALACGTPVVSTDCPSGPREILDNGRFGPLVPIADDAALARAISAMLDDPPSPQALTARAQQFTVERAATRYIDLLFGPRPYRSLFAGESLEIDLAVSGSRPIELSDGNV